MSTDADKDRGTIRESARMADAIPKQLLAKIAALPADRIAELDDFVEFIVKRGL